MQGPIVFWLRYVINVVDDIMIYQSRVYVRMYDRIISRKKIRKREIGITREDLVDG